MLKICCCWDDGVLNDLRLTELLRKYQAKATFNLNPGLMQQSRHTNGYIFHGSFAGREIAFQSGKLGLGELTDVYEGFEVASHGWTHCNAGSCPDEQFFADAMDARKYLEDRFQRICTGYAWPCGKTTPTTAKMLAEAGFSYGRTVENTSDVRAFTDPMLLASSCHYLSPDFEKLMEEARAGSGYFYFWGHSYEMMDVPELWALTEKRLRAISENPDNCWINVVDLVRR